MQIYTFDRIRSLQNINAHTRCAQSCNNFVSVSIFLYYYFFFVESLYIDSLFVTLCRIRDLIIPTDHFAIVFSHFVKFNARNDDVMKSVGECTFGESNRYNLSDNSSKIKR